jgi:hypothetical protein
VNGLCRNAIPGLTISGLTIPCWTIASSVDVIDRMPCAVTLLPVPKTSMSFYGFDEYERLVLAASALDATAHLIVLLGGEARLRCGSKLSQDGVHILRPHVLLASLDARGAAEGDPGARRACGSDDDPAVHAPQSGSPRRGDRAAGSAVGRSKLWRYIGNGCPAAKTISESGRKTGGEAGIRTLGRAFDPTTV